MGKVILAVMTCALLAATVAAQNICVRVQIGEQVEFRPFPCPTPEQPRIVSVAIDLAPDHLSLRVGESATVKATVHNTDGLVVSGERLDWLPTVDVQEAFPTCMILIPKLTGLQAEAVITGRVPGECGVTAVMGIGNNLYTAGRPVSVTVLPAITTRLEAKTAVLTAPMVLQDDFLLTTSADAGIAEFTFHAESSTYTVWALVRAPTASQDSFYVSVGGTEDVFDMAENKWSEEWQWTKLNGRGTGGPLTVNPRLLTLSAGTHVLTFRGREPGAALRAIVITADPDYVPQ